MACYVFILRKWQLRVLLFAASIFVAVFAKVAIANPEPELPVFEKWEWMRSTCMNCDIAIVAKTRELESVKVQAFMRALAEQKPELQKLYAIHGAEYNLLAQMAIGILGRESKFFESPRYQFKEEFPWAVYLAKVTRSYLTGAKVDPNSRGPTQIKTIPAKIAAHYGITSGDLDVPANAAVATMGFLIEALAELKTRAVMQNLTFVTPATYPDYLPYIYFGSTKTLVAGKARPETNSYVQDMKKYMEWVDIFEAAPAAPASARY